MIQRRDVLLGVAVLVVLCMAGMVALMVLTAAALDEPLITEPGIAIVDIAGVIYAPGETVHELERYLASDKIPVIVIRLNTPGGGVAATQEIYETVLKARRAGKTVIASMGTAAASGGYYIAVACDTIMANPATITGSIGVIATYPNLSGLYEKLGIDYNVLKSGRFKDTGSTSRPMTEDEREYLNSVIDDTFDQFLTAVADGRGMDVEEVRGYADGRIFTGRQALERGLIDETGTFQDAVDLAGEVAGLGPSPTTYRDERTDFWELVSEGMSRVIPGGLIPHLPSVSYLVQF